MSHTKLSDQLEVVSDTKPKLFGYCIGTDGYRLNLGYILDENYEVSVLVGGAIKLWDGGNRFGTYLSTTIYF